MSYFRPNIEAMSGYTPGEQPQVNRIIKINTNENPYPPSPKAVEALKNLDCFTLRRYPEPISQPVINAACEVYGCAKNEVIVGNGSDDILTILFRSFAGENDTAGSLDPSYSLYPVLSNIQGATFRKISLTENFDLPEDLAEQAEGCSLFFITCPNAPTANVFDQEKIKDFCRKFNGIVVIDEAYADFAEQNCLEFYKEFDNVVITRTLSKSYSLAGIRLGLAFANPTLIGGMLKVKDSYNVNALSQTMAEQALLDQEYFKECTEKILATREMTAKALEELGFEVLPSQTNFRFVLPPVNALTYFEELKKRHIFTRYFKDERISKYVRVSIGTEEEMQEFLSATKEIIK